nr:PKD domain-containing protein [Salsipaludibacter albus]
MSAARLRTLLRTDDTLFVDDTDRLFYVRPEAPREVRADVGEAQAVTALAQSFELHSRPGANRTIFLDFDGYQLPDGTAWSRNGYFADPYDTNNNPGTFSSAELAVVQSVWARVAEDYAPFDVDVTTEDPGIDAIRRSSSGDQVYGTRVVITDEGTNCGCGGVAYLGVFDVTGSTHDYYQPAWVYTQGVGDGAHNIAEAASHEAGHNLGLNHDGTSNQGYYIGHGAWAPIMGVGYYEPITQWSRGEYADANNTENDWSVMASNGAPPLSDDHGTRTSPTDLGGSGTIDASGMITPQYTGSTPNDVDAFAFTAGAGAATFTASPSEVLPNLDIALTLRTSSGTVVATADPVSTQVSGDRADGLAASLSVDLAAGNYVLEVDGVGARNPSTTGYSDYGSVGPYTLTGSHVAGGGGTPDNQAPTAAASASPSSGTAPLAVTLSAAGSSDPDGSIVSTSWDFGDGSSGSGTTVSHTYGVGTFTATVTVTDDDGATDTDSVTITATTGSTGPPAAPSNVTATESGRREATVSWTDNATNETGFVVELEKQRGNGSWGEQGTVQVGANTTSTVVSGGRGTYRFVVRAVNGDGSSAGVTSNVVELS